MIRGPARRRQSNDELNREQEHTALLPPVKISDRVSYFGTSSEDERRVRQSNAVCIGT